MEKITEQTLHEKYISHPIFNQLNVYSEFYDSLSNSIAINGWTSAGTTSINNIDAYFFLSIKGTLDSINDLLFKKRINDAYALLRKYYDLAIINIYTNLYLKNNLSIENFIVSKINNWIIGKEKIPSFEIMSKYIIKSTKLLDITALLYKKNDFKESSFEEIRARCNDHIHYLHFNTLLSNVNEIYDLDRFSKLNEFSKDLREIFTLHFSYLFSLNDHYLMSSDYIDELEFDKNPNEEYKYDVAPFFQEIFDKEIKAYRPDIAKALKDRTNMNLE